MWCGFRGPVNKPTSQNGADNKGLQAFEKMTRFEETCELETDRFSLALIWKKGD